MMIMPEYILLSSIIFLSLLVVIFFIRSNNILVTSLLSSAFSLFSVVMYSILDAPDVAMTEAAVSVLASVFSVYTIRSIYKYSYVFEEKFNIILFILCMSLAGGLIYASMDLPEFGSASAISQQRAASYYLNNTNSDIGIPSIVAAILGSYRAYDTLLETIVILVGGISILLVSNPIDITSFRYDQLVSKLSRFIIPAILLFALYIQFHGEISPGGGFQAGAIMAVAFILYALAFGEDKLLQLVSLAKLKLIAVIGTGLYFFTGLVSLFLNSSFLNYNAFLRDNILSQKIGIVTIELGVGIAVCATMLLIYFCLALNNDKSNEYEL